MDYYSGLDDLSTDLVDGLNFPGKSYPPGACVAPTQLDNYRQSLRFDDEETWAVQSIDASTDNVKACLPIPDGPLFDVGYPEHTEHFSRLQFGQPCDTDSNSLLDRSERYISPTGHWGGDLSCSDMESCHASERGWSPTTNQRVIPYPGDLYNWNTPVAPEEETPYPCDTGFCPAGSGGAYFGQQLGPPQLSDVHADSIEDVPQYPDPDPERKEPRARSVKREIDTEQDHAESQPPLQLETSQEVHDDDLMDEESCRDDGEESEDNFSDYSPRKCSVRRAGNSRSMAPDTVRGRRRRLPRRATNGTNYRARKSTKQSTASRIRNHNKTRKSRPSHPPRPFRCSFAPYECAATFGSKNEWKRHIASQHLQLGYFRCDVGQCNPENVRTENGAPGPSRGYNDFNRKDLFTQHLRRMHAPWSQNKTPSAQTKDAFEESLDVIRRRCWRERRLAPQQSVCGFCSHVFMGPTSWDERMEHVGKHYEKGDVDEGEDKKLRDWAIQEGLIESISHERWRLKGSKDGRSRIKMKVIEAEADGEQDAEGDDE